MKEKSIPTILRLKTTRFLIAGKLKSLTDGAGPPYFVGETIAFLQMPVIPLKKLRLEIEP